MAPRGVRVLAQLPPTTRRARRALCLRSFGVAVELCCPQTCGARAGKNISREKGTRKGAAALRVGLPPLHLAYCATLFTLELHFRGLWGGGVPRRSGERDADPGTNLGRGPEQGWRTGE